jgi:ankyrin repeat protein
MLVSTGSVPRECHVQIALIDLLCDYGANPDKALQAAALHGEGEAVDALLRRGASLTLPVAAALGRIDDFRHLLSTANGAERHLALALAAQHARIEIVRLLLDSGEEPNRYNPLGAHSHSTPLHQAALSGNHELVRLLIERGAKADIKDLLWQGTPADWAHHEGRLEIEAYLRRCEISNP